MRRFLIVFMIVSFSIVLLPITAAATDDNEMQTEIEYNHDLDSPEPESAPEYDPAPGTSDTTDLPEPETTDPEPYDYEYPEEEPLDEISQEPANEIHGENELIEPPPRDYDEIINVVLPMNVNFIIDPFDLMESGQIHSVPHVFENRSEHDIVITFSDISVTFANDIGFLPMSEPFDDTFETPLKAIYMALGFSSLGEGAFFPVTSPESQGIAIPIVLQAFGTTTNVCAYNYCTGECTDETHGIYIIRHYQTALSIMGNVNATPETPWASGDVRLSLNYNIEIIP